MTTDQQPMQLPENKQPPVAPTSGEVVCLRGENGEKEYRVYWGTRVCSPAWKQRGPAEAYLSLLRKGRKPEYYFS